MEEAKSGRAKCKICSQNIEGGTTRVGVERFAVC
jgi:ribosome-binding protein aMBF1 (putative translation factor)